MAKSANTYAVLTSNKFTYWERKRHLAFTTLSWIFIATIAILLLRSWSLSVDGHWSDFGPYGSCSVTCGSGGKMTRNRTCNNPRPSGLWASECAGHESETHGCSTNISCSAATTSKPPYTTTPPACTNVQGTSGQVTSPNYPSPYAPNLNLCTVINVPPGKRVNMTLIDYQLERGGWDCVYFFDGPLVTSRMLTGGCGGSMIDSWQQVRRNYGMQLPPILLGCNSTQSSVRVTFTTDGSNKNPGTDGTYDYRGFKLTFQEC